MIERLTEASSLAGLGLVISGAAGLVLNWKNPAAWAEVLGGIAAILKREGRAA